MDKYPGFNAAYTSYDSQNSDQYRDSPTSASGARQTNHSIHEGSQSSSLEKPYPGPPPPPFQVVASQGYGHQDHLTYPPTSQAYIPPPLPQENSGILTNKNAPRFQWILPTVVLGSCIIMFLVEMIVNNCPDRATGGDKCVISFLGPLSFQPLKENPMFGPSTQAMLDTGALDSDKVVNHGQGWRLFTCMWLHAGVIHLVSNMLSFWWIGLPLQRDFGTVKIAIIYLLSGFGGSLMSALFIINSISVGASGAVMGLLGATLADLLINWGRYTSRVAALCSLFFIIAITLILGLMPYVDNFCHIGGFVSGFLLGLLLLVHPKLEWEQLRDNPVGYSIGGRGKKFSKCQTFTRIIVAVLLIAGFLAAIISLFTGVDANKGCDWCHYLSCVETSLWDCSASTSSTPLTCRLLTAEDGARSMVCPDLTTHVLASTDGSTSAQLSTLCSQLCG